MANGDWFKDADIADLSQAGAVLGGRYTDRTDGYADLVGAEDGQIVWRVKYEAGEEPALTLEGPVPPDVRKVLDEQTAQARGDDEDLPSMEVVTAVWAAMVGFQPYEETKLAFTLATGAPAASKPRKTPGFWQRIMRR